MNERVVSSMDLTLSQRSHEWRSNVSWRSHDLEIEVVELLSILPLGALYVSTGKEVIIW
jgi:hypothetical protein